MRTVFLLMMCIGVGGIALIKTGNTNGGLALITFAYYFFTLLVVLGIRKFLHFLLNVVEEPIE